MKTLFLILVLSFSQLSIGQTFEKSFPAVIRTEKNKPITTEIKLTDLISEESFDGKYFKIVQGKSEEAISFKASEDLLLRAATVYFHLMKARSFFVDNLQSEYVQSIQKMVIRIDHTNQFSELGHFAHDNLSPQYNNALTIPAGKGLASRGVKPWGMEIWFRPSKKVHISDLNVNNLGSLEYLALIKQFRDQRHMQTLQRFFAQTVTGMINGHNPGLESIIRLVGSSLVMEAAYQLFDPITQTFSRKWYWLDTALVPEIIYHEYAHAALSDYLVLSHSTAIIEGMADFFAGQIANSPTLAKNIKKYNTYNGKNAKRKKNYMIQFETTDYANTDFIFGLLWEMKKIVGQDIGNGFMYEMRKELTTNSTIRRELIEALLSNCEKKCKEPFNDKLRILKALNSRGI